MLPDRYFDWHRLHADEHTAPAVVDSRRRVWLCLAGFLVLLLVVFGRVVQLEVTQGDAFRAEASKPLVRRHAVPGVRGRIIDRNGTVLACDKNVPALAVHYRYLQNPADKRWLRWTARSRLSGKDQKDPQRLAAEEKRLLDERNQLAHRLAELSGLSQQEWNSRAERIQAQVERISQSVNQRRQEQFDRRRDGRQQEVDARQDEDQSIGSLLREVLAASIDESPPEWITVAEELDYHVMAEDLTLTVVADIESHPETYPGIKIVERSRRIYPSGALAAHLVGHVGPAGSDDTSTDGDDAAPYHPDEFVGRMGLERYYEQLLRGRRGEAIELADHSGRVLTAYRQREPGVGRDLVLTIDAGLQSAAEMLLAGALERRKIRMPEVSPAGGAIVVLDVQTGAVLAAASAPSFDPNIFSTGSGPEVQAMLAAPAHPLFNRVTKMAIPPGSVFKVVSAVALLEESEVDAGDPFVCQGYLHSPDSWRCAVYRRHGTGHGETTLTDALAESCNVYFFHHAGLLGHEPLVYWSLRFGFEQPTGIDLPGEVSGTLPSADTIRRLEGRDLRAGDTLAMSVGQSMLEVTPLQVVRMMAAIANGGKLVTPHVVGRLGLPEIAKDRSTDTGPPDIADDPIKVRPPSPISGLDARTLAVVREGLERVVSDPAGTGYGSVRLETVEIAGKTGTAETGTPSADHAWFAGYVPAEKPKLAFVVVIEHAGNAEEAAGPVARRLVQSMQQQGYFSDRPGSLASRETADAAGQ